MITNYATLQTELALWLNRSDLTSIIPTFVQLAEKEIARRLAGAAAFSPLSVSSTNWVIDDHPDVYLYGSLLESAPYLKDDPRVAVWASEFEKRIAGVLRARSDTAASLANYAGLQAAVIKWLDREDLSPVITTLIAMAESSLRRAMSGVDIPALASAPGNTNWLLTSHPDIYLYATLVEAAPYLKDDARVALWRGEVDARVPGALRSRDALAVDSTTYAGFQTIVSKWLDRADLAPMIPLFIRYAEASLRRVFAGRTIAAVSGASTNWLFDSHNDVYLYATLVEAAPYLGQDDRVATWKSELAARTSVVLRARDEAAPTLATYAGLLASVATWLDRSDLTSKIPTFVSLAELEIFPDLVGWNMEDADEDEDTIPTTTLEALATATGNTNWLFERHPDVYLFGTLKQASLYLNDDASAMKWDALYQTRLAAVHGRTDTSEFLDGQVRSTTYVFGG